MMTKNGMVPTKTRTILPFFLCKHYVGLPLWFVVLPSALSD